MNDIGYRDVEFKGSPEERHIQNVIDPNILEHYMDYNKIAAEYQIKEGNPKQSKFFQQAVAAYEKRLVYLHKQAEKELKKSLKKE